MASSWHGKKAKTLAPDKAETMVNMKKSLFRLTDILELCIAYTFCFSLNMIFGYVKTLLHSESYLC